jgi:hypothetical protein
MATVLLEMPKRLTNHAFSVEGLHRESAVGLEDQRRRLAQIGAGLLQRPTLRVGAG